jgi:N-acyl-D-aspartate/D-glutamate deacylase
VFVWQVVSVETVERAEHESLIGRSVSHIAEEQGKDPLDVFLDLSIAEGLRMQFVLAAPPNRRQRAVTEACIRSPFTMPGSSDGGAHLLSFCGADYSTRLLAEWVPDVLTIEQAVARLTSIPARAYGLEGRGTLVTGAAADVLCIDRSQLGAAETPRYVRDFPANSGRYVVDATGYRAVIVNGEVMLRDGGDTGARPGVVLRSSS